MAKIVVRIISFALYLIFVSSYILHQAIDFHLEWRTSHVHQHPYLHLIIQLAIAAVLWAMHISLIQIWHHWRDRAVLISRLAILFALLLSPFLFRILPFGQADLFIPLITSFQMLVCSSMLAFVEILLSNNQFKEWCRKSLDPLFFINLLGAAAIWGIAFFLFIESSVGWDGLGVMVVMLYGSAPILLFLGLLLVFLERAFKKLWTGGSQLEYSQVIAGLMQSFLVIVILALSVLAMFKGFGWQWDWSVLLKISSAMLLWSLLVVTGQNWIHRHQMGKEKAKREVKEK